MLRGGETDVRRCSRTMEIGMGSCIRWEKMKKIADYLGIHYSTVSRSVRRQDKERCVIAGPDPIPL